MLSKQIQDLQKREISVVHVNDNQDAAVDLKSDCGEEEIPLMEISDSDVEGSDDVDFLDYFSDTEEALVVANEEKLFLDEGTPEEENDVVDDEVYFTETEEEELTMVNEEVYFSDDEVSLEEEAFIKVLAFLLDQIIL